MTQLFFIPPGLCLSGCCLLSHDKARQHKDFHSSTILCSFNGGPQNITDGELCISRRFAIPTLHNNTLSSPRFTIFDRQRVRETHVTPKTGVDMSLRFHVEAGAYESTASTASSVSGRSQTVFSQSASQNAESSDSEEDILAARDFAQRYRNQALYEIGTGLPQSSFVTKLDPEVEALIMRINENVVIRDVATKNPQSILVPKGYLVDNEVKPSKFYETRGEVRDHVKKRKREGILPRQSKKQWRNERHGFRAQEVNWNGAVHLEGCKPSNLSNDIHPLFDRSNFDDTPDAIYDQLLPGLQLATMFLTQKICMQFWVTLAMGDRRDDAEMTSRNGKLSQRIDKHVELTEERARTVIEHINAIGKSKLIHFRFRHKLEGVWGTSAPICEYRGIEREYHGLKGDLVRSIVRIHSDYYIIAKKLSQLKYQEISQKLRFNFLFAVLIIHELVSRLHSISFVRTILFAYANII